MNQLTRQLWTKKLRTFCAAFTVCAMLATTTPSAEAAQPAADPLSGLNFDFGPTPGQWVGIGAGIAAIGIGIGLGIYYGTHHNRKLTGCAATGPNGLELVNEGDQQTYSLMGDVSSSMAGERIRVSGKKRKNSAVAKREFLVEKVTKDFGVCKAKPDAH